jgi:hypothetical protein
MPFPRMPHPMPRTAAAIEARMGALHVGAQLHEDLGLARPATKRGPGEAARPA